jgi:hypothetical protein
MRIPRRVPNRYYGSKLNEKQGYSLCTIEFDDQGELWDPGQLDNALKCIKKVCGDSQGGNCSKGCGEVIVITFAHGWMHNASPQDENFIAFERILCTRAQEEREFAKQQNCQPRPIVGVYLAWRGLPWDIPFIKYLTFWSRKKAALRVGHLSCTEAILRIIRVVKSRNDESKCLFIGHSFGGLILENAIVQALLGAIFQKVEQPDSSTVVDSPVDLIVLVNPACEASIAKQFTDILRRNNVKVQKQIKQGLPFPLLVSITSVGDRATKYLFPLGQFFTNALKSFRKYNDRPLGFPSQRYLHTHTAGHIPSFQTFMIQRISNNEIDKEKLVFSWNKGQDKYEIVCQSKDFNCLPFWLMQAPKEIIPDHSNVFTEAFVNMLSAFLHWTTTSVEKTKIECKSPEQALP